MVSEQLSRWDKQRQVMRRKYEPEEKEANARPCAHNLLIIQFSARQHIIFGISAFSLNTYGLIFLVHWAMPMRRFWEEVRLPIEHGKAPLNETPEAKKNASQCPMLKWQHRALASLNAASPVYPCCPYDERVLEYRSKEKCSCASVLLGGMRTYALHKKSTSV